MPRKTAIDQSALTKMELRKLNALKKSIGEDIGAKAFLEWMRKRPAKKAEPVDKTAKAISDAIMKLIDSGKIKALPRSGYVVKRGSGRVVVEAVK